ncbi:MAG: hypothetical protein ACMUIG_03370 [Thermoplasmatota archaeon]
MSGTSDSRINILLVVVSIVLLAGSITLGYFLFREDKEEDTYLKVEEVYFFQKDLGDYDSSIDIIIMITNTGDADVSKISVRGFAIETDSNLAQYDASVVLTNVKGKTTVEGRMSIVVPNGDAYRVELLIFQDDRLTIMGYGNIDLTGVGIVSDYKDVEPGSGGMNADDMAAGAPEMSSASSLGVCMIVVIMALAFIALIVIIAVYASRKAVSDSENMGDREMQFKTLESPRPGEKESDEIGEIKRAKPIDMLAEPKEDDEKEDRSRDKEDSREEGRSDPTVPAS